VSESAADRQGDGPASSRTLALASTDFGSNGSNAFDRGGSRLPPSMPLGDGGYRAPTYEERWIAWAEQARIRAAFREAEKNGALP
jgi:hypothetical protein